MNVSPQAYLATLKLALVKRPLWKVKSVADFLDIDPDQVREQIESGELPFAFNISAILSRNEPRILSASAVEKKFGVISHIGATKNLKLNQIIDLILPKRNLRSTELARRLSCAHGQVYRLADHFRVTRPAAAKDGPHSFTVFSRESVADFLTKRRMA